MRRKSLAKMFDVWSVVVLKCPVFEFAARVVLAQAGTDDNQGGQRERSNLAGKSPAGWRTASYRSKIVTFKPVWATLLSLEGSVAAVDLRLVRPIRDAR